MKRTIITLVILTITIGALSQPPQAFKYQTLVRDGTGDILQNQSISLRMSIHQGSVTGTIVYKETHSVSTNEFGMVAIEIGNGIPVIGIFSDIEWGNNDYYLKTELDPTGGVAYVSMGTSQLLSVPYAQHSKTSGGDGDWTISGNDITRDIGKVGIGTTNPEFKLSLDNDGGILAMGSYGTGTTLTTMGQGTRLIWYPKKGAFRAGYVNNNTWDDVNIGDLSIAMGSETQASGYGSIALGSVTTASGDYSTTMGVATIASGGYSTAMGYNTEVNGQFATAMGHSTVASGNTSIAMGSGATASGDNSTALGMISTASGVGSMSMGYNTIASAAYSTALGYFSEASGEISTAMGRNTTASGDKSTAMGSDTEATGLYSTAMGTGTQATGEGATSIGWHNNASGDISTAMGQVTMAKGENSTSMGYATTARGDYSTSMGYETTAKAYSSTSIGRYNVGNGDTANWIATDPLFEIGNGQYGNPSNALTVLKNGQVGIGTETPAEKLHIVGNLRLEDAFYDSNNLPGITGQLLQSTGTATNWVDATLIDDGDWTISGNDIIRNVGKVGIGTINPEFRLSIENDGGILAIGEYGTGTTLTTTGAGTRLIWYPKKAAFRVGYADSDVWDDANIGDYSIAMGKETTASGQISTAMGLLSEASGTYSTAMGWGTIASGAFSTAMGLATVATESASTAMGQYTVASGDCSTAMGWGNVASGQYSTATGFDVEANGQYSIAMGSLTISNGLGSTAMGNNTLADGNYSTAMGLFSKAESYLSVALGRYNVGNGDPVTWVATDPLLEIGNGNDANNKTNALTVLKNGKVGIGTSTPEFKLSMDNDGGILAFGSYGNGTTLTTTGAGTRLIWYPKKAAFRVGYVDSDSWDDVNIGNSSTAMGSNTKASGHNSTAIGLQTTASGANSMAMGWLTVASGQSSTAMGQNATASGQFSTAMGNSTASGGYSTAMGQVAAASGDYSTAMGQATRAIARSSTAIGSYNIGFGDSQNWIATDPVFEIGNGQDGILSNALTVLKNGKVGIGIATPNYQLDVDLGNVLIQGTNSFQTTGDQGILYLGSVHSYIKAEYGYGLKIGTYAAADALNIEEAGGNVAIGTTNAAGYKLYVNGSAYSTGGWQSSDAKYKENISAIQNPLDKLMNLEGVSFQWKADEFPSLGFPEGQHYGVIAQEIEEVLPDVVNTDPDGNKAVSYTEIIPVLIEAMKEQQELIKELRKEVNELKYK